MDAAGVSRGRRILLLCAAMGGTWVFYTFLLALDRLLWNSFLEVWPLSLWAGLFALIALLIFAAPLVTAISPRLQLRWAGGLLLLAVLSGNLLIALFFRQTARKVWNDLRQGDLFPLTFNLWVSLFALVSCATYLFLLREQVAQARAAPGDQRM